MGLPDNNNGRLFVGGVAPGTGDVDLRRHFRRYGEVAEVYQARDRLTGRPRGFAFVQFPRPADAGRALADPRHVINGQQVTNPTLHEDLSMSIDGSVSVLPKGTHCKKKMYLMSRLKITFGPLGPYEECPAVDKVRRFGEVINGVLIFELFIGYFSEDGRECLVRWPPAQGDGEQPAAPSAGQGNIVQAWRIPLGDLAKLAPDVNLADPSCSPEAGESQNWSWLVFKGHP
ncbi:hypothetical protein C2845_PM05G28460 [Panicum miliaceum]|uniref:RRM domain-containing protein n=1 Tax=Panicum miliaceum TaxID=4540 RepID=A0A3L6SZF3_PANMI|nr:hypothetical protein C2845_PM05G28460 [Panicum miliaceum]